MEPTEENIPVLQRVKQAWETIPKDTKGQQGVILGFNSTTHDVNVLPFHTDPYKMTERVRSAAAFLEMTESDTYVIAFEVVVKPAESQQDSGVRPTEDDDGPVDGCLFIVNMGKGKVTTFLMKYENEGTVYTVPNSNSPLLRQYSSLAPGDEVRDVAAKLFEGVTSEQRRSLSQRFIVEEEMQEMQGN